MYINKYLYIDVVLYKVMDFVKYAQYISPAWNLQGSYFHENGSRSIPEWLDMVMIWDVSSDCDNDTIL